MNPSAPRPSWKKSTHSGNQGGDCVEVSAHAAHIHVRDTKNRTGPSLTFTPAEWEAFVAGVKKGFAR
ncbi:hypothetical protein SRB5_13430 [Streptomyces sp. RB5]|uniref:DUF397 domain-containing protein n=1 Tax=Streptomyces smaragdinus TaxID=2585196 RepID=A0A7K0CCP3_9ACTN|nr:DUF397 domain-containing protein [Streptomyces smaragdinus]MQY11228.1 hypothetical protein [Streptomyces smaragdinus]